jgi:hypothetical protein
MSFLAKNTQFAERHGFGWHSTPSSPDGYVLWDKGVYRKQRALAWDIILGHQAGDKGWAAETLRRQGHYTDPDGRQQYNDNPNMCSGRAIQRATDHLLVDDADARSAYSAGLECLEAYKGGEWRDADEDKATMAHRLAVKYAQDGSKPRKKKDEPETKATHCEFELVYDHSIAGLREAMAGDNRIIGETKLTGELPRCLLPYLGFGDYQEGRVELKTQWDSRAHTDSPAANSLPNDIKEPHLIQIAGYHHISGKRPSIVYANRLGYRVFTATDEQLEFGFARLLEASRRREALLRFSSSIAEVLQLCDPQWSHPFVWRNLHPQIIQEAKKLWSE